MWLGLCFTTKELLHHLARQAGLCPIAPSVIHLDAGSSAPLILGFLVGPWWFLGSFSRAFCFKTFPLTSGFFQLWIQVLPVSLETALAIIPSTLVVTLHHSSLLKKKKKKKDPLIFLQAKSVFFNKEALGGWRDGSASECFIPTLTRKERIRSTTLASPCMLWRAPPPPHDLPTQVIHKNLVRVSWKSACLRTLAELFLLSRIAWVCFMSFLPICLQVSSHGQCCLCIWCEPWYLKPTFLFDVCFSLAPSCCFTLIMFYSSFIWECMYIGNSAKTFYVSKFQEARSMLTDCWSAHGTFKNIYWKPFPKS